MAKEERSLKKTVYKYKGLSQIEKMQVRSFKSIFEQEIRLGNTIEMAFATAIVVTSDEAMKRAAKGNWRSVKQAARRLTDGEGENG
ncbi:MAG: hypothetical protein PHP01_06520 [Phycisphaerae bacterium]|nr:hypothetical protein [Phycisphaerae bacterium]